MKKSKHWFLLSNFLALMLAPGAWAIRSTSPDSSIVVTKSLWGATGNANLQGGVANVGFAWGEQTSGYQIVGGAGAVADIGYYGGELLDSQPLKVLRILAASIGPLVGTVQLGVPIQGQVEVDFAQAIDGGNLLPNISLSLQQDHLGQVQNISVPYYITFDPAVNTIYLNSLSGWLGNSLYDVSIANALQSSDGFTNPSTMHYRFVTLLDPSQENVVFTPVDAPAAAAAAGENFGNSSNQALRVDLAPSAFADFSFLQVNDNPQTQPLQVNPQAIADANQKIANANGPYSKPIALEEVLLFNSQNQSVSSLSSPAHISWPYNNNGLLTGTSVPVRSDTLALYSLDTEHHLWVRLPASSPDGNAKTVDASISKFSVFALMGSGDGTASFVSVFPVPWRPHGPNAGAGPGQTGTEAGGITFTNLPSECSIRIYTLSGNLVQEIHHSDTTGPTGQESWLALTSGGQHAASGVYLWEVESSVDKKTGKLIIIR